MQRWIAALAALSDVEILAIDISLSEAKWAKDWKTWCRYMNNALALYL